MIVKHEVSKTEEKYWDRFPALKLVTSSMENVLIGKSWSNRAITSKGSSHSEYCRQLVMFKCKNPKPCELPYSIDGIVEDTAAALWYHALTRSNPPEERTFPYNEEFIAEVEKLNFDEFDENKAKELKDKFSVCKRGVKLQLDAEDIELDEES